jgi:hypothetical protein
MKPMTYENLLETMSEDAMQLEIAALKCESLIPHVAGELQKARIQLTAAVFREKAERLDLIVNFVRGTENDHMAQVPVVH